MEKLANASHFLDLGGLDQLRSQAQKDEKSALKEVAKQFEGIFVQMLMKSMRDANEVFKSDSPFNTRYTAFYEQMRDQQLSVDLSDKGTLGIADLMVEQLSPQTGKIKPASTLRQDGQPSTGIPFRIKTHVERNIADNKIVNKNKPATADDVLSGKITPTQAKQTFADKTDFINRLYPHAKQAADKLGTDPNVLIAQSALETGWGQKVVRQSNGETSNNLFNIKATKGWKGNKARVSTLEFEQGVAVRQQADFRVYDDIKQSFDDFVNFLSGGERYQDALKAAHDPRRFIQGLQKAGYATDPNYTQKVMSVMKSVVAGK